MLIDVLSILCLMIIVSIVFLTMPRVCEYNNNEVITEGDCWDGRQWSVKH